MIILSHLFIKIKHERRKNMNYECELLRLIEIGASCFNHYCIGYVVA